MLPMHTTIKGFAFASFIFFASCANRSDKDLISVKILEEGLENSNRFANQSISEIMNSLEAKLYDYSSKEKAQVWLPKAKAIQKISDEAIEEINNVKSKLESNGEKKIKDNDLDTIVNLLLRYRNDIMQIDSRLTKDYKTYLSVFTRDIDSLEDSSMVKIREYFSEICPPMALAMLTKIENNIRLNEQGMITYCHEMSTPIFCGVRNSYAAIAILNTTLIEPKGKLEITAGLGSFSTYQSPKVYFYDRLFNITEDGAAHYKFKAASNPGKYHVPVRIEYIDENGKHNVIQKEIEYTVVNIQKQ